MVKKEASDIQRMKSVSSMFDLVAKTKGTLIAPREVINNLQLLAPEAVLTLERLMKTSKADSVKLKAALEILALGGVNKETTVRVTHEVTDLDDKEIDSRLADLLGVAHGIVIEGEATAMPITPIREELDNEERREEAVAH